MTQQTDISLEPYLDRNIKEIIDEFPTVAEILEKFNIGCVTCGLGTCKFRDIVDIHDLDAEDEAALLAGIARSIFPGRDINVPKIERKSRPKEQPSYSPPMRKLVDEHKLIKRWLALIPGVIEDIDLSTGTGRDFVRKGIEFIQSYADRFHHAKEEDILFKEFDEELDIVKTIRADHENARAMVRTMLAALERGDKDTVVANFRAYAGLLTEHIKKEDEILYLWMDKNLTTRQIGELFSSFTKKDEEFGETPQRQEQFIKEVEIKYSQEE